MQLVGSIDISPADFLRSVGEVFAVFDGPTHDSGNVSYGVSVEGRRYFVKTAGREDHRGERVAVLRNAVALARSCEHPCLPQLHGVIESPNGPMLVYEWCSGDLVRAALQRFRSLPAPEIERVLDAIVDLHRALVRAGWIASDFYDGSLLYDFTTGALHVIDLDVLCATRAVLQTIVVTYRNGTSGGWQTIYSTTLGGRVDSIDGRAPV